MLNKICFAIDNGHDLHTEAKFLRAMDTHRALGDMKGSFIPCVGMYKGVIEDSYIMDERDYLKFVDRKGWTENQQSILHIPADVRQPCTLEFPLWSETTGPMRELSDHREYNSWTYVKETGKFFSTEKAGT